MVVWSSQANHLTIRFVPIGYIQEELPFSVTRTPVGKQLPVYTDYKNGRTRVVTLLRKYEGDETVLADEVQRVCGEVRAETVERTFVSASSFLVGRECYLFVVRISPLQLYHCLLRLCLRRCPYIHLRCCLLWKHKISSLMCAGGHGDLLRQDRD